MWAWGVDLGRKRELKMSSKARQPWQWDKEASLQVYEALK